MDDLTSTEEYVYDSIDALDNMDSYNIFNELFENKINERLNSELQQIYDTALHDSEAVSQKESNSFNEFCTSAGTYCKKAATEQKLPLEDEWYLYDNCYSLKINLSGSKDNDELVPYLILMVSKDYVSVAVAVNEIYSRTDWINIKSCDIKKFEKIVASILTDKKRIIDLLNEEYRLYFINSKNLKIVKSGLVSVAENVFGNSRFSYKLKYKQENPFVAVLTLINNENSKSYREDIILKQFCKDPQKIRVRFQEMKEK